MNLQEQFEKETKIGEYTKTNDPETYWKSYVKWLEQSHERVSVDVIVTLLHEKATVIEDRSIDNFKPSNVHEFHTQIDTARCLRVAANTLSGDQAG